MVAKQCSCQVRCREQCAKGQTSSLLIWYLALTGGLWTFCMLPW